MKKNINGNKKNVEASLFDQLSNIFEQDCLRRIGIPRAELESLATVLLCSESGPTSNRDILIVVIYHALVNFRKRYVGPSSVDGNITETSRREATLKAMLVRNDQCMKYNVNYMVNPSSIVSKDLKRNFVNEIIGEAQLVLEHATAYGMRYNLSSLATSMKNGSGASSGVSGDPTTYSRLYSGPISFSSELVQSLYYKCTELTPRTYAAELRRKYMLEISGEKDVVQDFAEYFQVEKTNRINRSCGKHPSGNMALDLGVHDITCAILRQRFHIDLEFQANVNKFFARLGSRGLTRGLSRSYQFCTMDLKVASDYPVATFHRLYPMDDNFSRLIGVLRVKSLLIEDGVNPPYLMKKHFLSSMGNGFTFAVMTLLFTSIIESLYKASSIPTYDMFYVSRDEYADLGIPESYKDSPSAQGFYDSLPYDRDTGYRYVKCKTYHVFGDDLIVDKSIYSALCTVLSDLGCIVNDTKSFSSGSFRESCGGDYYAGRDIRPVFIQRMETDQHLYSVFNRLNEWSCKHSIDITETLSFIRRNISSRKAHTVPRCENTDAGLQVPFSHRRRITDILPSMKVFQRPGEFEEPIHPSILYERLLRDYQNDGFYLATVPSRSARVIYKEKWGKPIRYTCLKTMSERTYKDFEGYTYFKVVNRKAIVCPIYDMNLHGLVLSMLNGSVYSGSYGVRPQAVRYTLKLRYVPNWDNSSNMGGQTYDDYSGNVYNFWSYNVSKAL